MDDYATPPEHPDVKQRGTCPTCDTDTTDVVEFDGHVAGYMCPTCDDTFYKRVTFDPWEE